jgi:hypothetical protein
MPRCGFIKANGEQCKVTFGLSQTTGYCFYHDPSREEEREAARSRGGKSAAKARRPWATDDQVPGRGPRTAQEGLEWASWCVEATARGWISEGVSQRISTAINTVLRAASQASMEREIAELKGQVAELRKRTSGR